MRRLSLLIPLSLLFLPACYPELKDLLGDEANDDEGDAADDDEGDDDEAEEADEEADWDLDEGTSGTLLAIGDSFFDTGELSIPGVAADALGLSVVNRAMSGALLVDGGDDIRSQYDGGDWLALVMTGGGNDLNETCDCRSCDAELDALLSADGRSGALATFVQDVLSDGIPVVYVGYWG